MDKTLRDISETLWPKEEGKMPAKCLYCQREFGRDDLFQHMWDAHRPQMLQARRDREDCKSGPVSDLLGKHGGPPTPRSSTLDNPDSLGDNVNLRPEDAAEQQATSSRPAVAKYPFMPKGVAPVEDLVAKQINELLVEIVKGMPTERRWDIKLAVLEIADGVLGLATLRITKG